MNLLATSGARRVWFGRAARPCGFRSPVPGEYALLLVIGAGDASDEEQAGLAEQFVRSGCRYAVCFGPTSSSWHDAIDTAFVMEKVHGRSPPFVMTTWHDAEPLDETAQFFADCTRFEGWSAEEFVVLVLGGSEQLEADARAAVLRQFR